MIKSGADVRKICIQNQKKMRCGYTTGTCAPYRRQSCSIYASGRAGSKEIKVITPMGASLTLQLLT